MGPILIRESSLLKKLYESLLVRYDSISRSVSLYLEIVWLSTIAPAASVGPSIPSVPTE